MAPHIPEHQLQQLEIIMSSTTHYSTSLPSLFDFINTHYHYLCLYYWCNLPNLSFGLQILSPSSLSFKKPPSDLSKYKSNCITPLLKIMAHLQDEVSILWYMNFLCLCVNIHCLPQNFILASTQNFSSLPVSRSCYYIYNMEGKVSGGKRKLIQNEDFEILVSWRHPEGIRFMAYFFKFRQRFRLITQELFIGDTKLHV